MLVFFFVTSTAANAQESLVVAGTGDSQALLRKLAVVFEKSHPGTRIEVPDSVGSGGGIKAVSRGAAGLGRTARPLKEKEKPGLTEVPFGKSPVVFATHGSLPQVKSLSRQQLFAIYSGKVRNWKEVGGPDAKTYPISREEGDSSLETINHHMPGFMEQSSVAKELFTTWETAEAIRDHRYTIGYLPLSMALDYGLHPLIIDGQIPDREHVDKGAYPYLTTLYLVKNDKASALALHFIDFVLSREAGALMLEQGVMPVQ